MEAVKNIQNEILFVGCVYKNPDIMIEYEHYIKEKYDFSDSATRFFYEVAKILILTRSQIPNKQNVITFCSENQERFIEFKNYGGYKTLESWQQLAIVEDVKSYFEILKKFSLLREYQRNGFNIEKIMNHKKFELFTALDIYKLIRGKADKIQTVILQNNEAEALNANIINTINACVETPQMGLLTPFPILNDVIRGLRTSHCLAVGMLSNAGKTRFMIRLIAYITLVMHEKVYILLNEMTIEEVRYALITTVINCPEFQELHGIKMTKREREITLGMYRDDYTHNFITMNTDDMGNFTESFSEYLARICESSTEYQNVMKIAEWVENQTSSLILAKDISSDYSDETLQFEIKKAKNFNQIKYVFYDTAKSDASDTGDWAAFKSTVTKLTELFKQLDMFGYLSIQLTDEAEYILPDELKSNHIANCKQIKHVIDSLILAKEIKQSEKSKYHYLAYADWGEKKFKELDEKKRYYVFNVDKNRAGRKPHLLFELDLDLNTWAEVGEIFKKE